jgi:hypothetical protein
MAFDIAGFLKVVAPVLGAAVGGPLGGIAVSAIGKAIGLDDATQETLSARLQGATQADLLALKKADQDFQARMKELDIGLEELQIKTATEDRASAREREIAVKDWIPGVMAMLVTIGFFGVLTWMLKYGVPKDGGSEALLVMLGALGAAWASIVSYYFGSSAQQVKQSAVISKIATSP